MPSPKNQKNGQNENHRKGRLGERSSSFHGQNTMSAAPIRRPKTVPDLPSYRNYTGAVPEVLPKQPPKLLLKVTVLGSLGPVQVLMKPESTVGDLVEAAVRQYVKERRRPILPSNVGSDFDLHFSQFSLESLVREEKLVELGSRNFFLCPRKTIAGKNWESGVTTSFASCGNDIDKVRDGFGGGGGGGGFGWLKLMHFML